MIEPNPLIDLDWKTSQSIEAIKNARNDRRLLPSGILLWSLGFGGGFGLILLFSSIETFLNINTKSLASFLASVSAMTGLLFFLLYSRFGTRSIRISNAKLTIEWKVFFPIRVYSINISDVHSFSVQEKSSASNGMWHVLGVDTSDGFFSLIESYDFCQLIDLNEKLNNALKSTKTRNKYNNAPIGFSQFGENMRAENEQYGEIFQENYKKSDDNKTEYYRHGSLNLYSLTIFLICDIFVISFSLIHFGVFFNVSYWPALVVFPVTALLAIGMTCAIIMMLISRYYQEYCCIENDHISYKRSFLGFTHVVVIRIDTIKMINVVFDDKISLMFGDKIFVPLFTKIVTWQLQVLDNDNRTLLLLSTLSKSESEYLANKLTSVVHKKCIISRKCVM